MGSEQLNCLTVLFKNSLQNEDIPKFRGAIIKHLEEEYGETSILFHNHDSGNFRWRYPLIQYKAIDGQAAIVCLEDAILDTGILLASLYRPIIMGRKKVNLSVEAVVPQAFSFLPAQKEACYSIKHWLPLNSSNYKSFENAESVSERASYLENILVGNILSMAKGLDVHIPYEISCVITELSSPHIFESKNVKMTSFDISFKTNLLLPDHIGLGKHASLGFGIIKKQ